MALVALAIAASFMIVAALLASARAQNRFGCGLHGGPGLRATDGHCVGWAQLARACGEPPTLRCTAEGPALNEVQNAR